MATLTHDLKDLALVNPGRDWVESTERDMPDAQDGSRRCPQGNR